MDQGDSFTTHNFGLQIDGVIVEYLSSISGFVYEQEVIKHLQNTAQGKPEVSLMPGVQKDGQIQVERGMTESPAFTSWIKDSMAGMMSTARKNASIIVMTTENEPAKRYHMRNAWCSKIEPGNLKAGEASILTETVTIVFEELVIE